MVCRVPLYLHATVESLWLTTLRRVLSSEAHVPSVKWKNLFLLPVSLRCLPSWLVWFHLWLIVREEWISILGYGTLFFSPSNSAQHPPSLAEPVIITGPKVTVKHLSDVVDVQSRHSFFCARGNSVRGPGCDTPHSVDWSDFHSTHFDQKGWLTKVFLLILIEPLFQSGLKVSRCCLLLTGKALPHQMKCNLSRFNSNSCSAGQCTGSHRTPVFIFHMIPLVLIFGKWLWCRFSGDPFYCCTVKKAWSALQHKPWWTGWKKEF